MMFLHCLGHMFHPIYSKEISFIKERLGLSMIINPELATAREISRLLRFPAAIKIDPFSRGRVELLKFKVLPEFDLDGMSISQITDKYRCNRQCPMYGIFFREALAPFIRRIDFFCKMDGFARPFCLYFI